MSVKLLPVKIYRLIFYPLFYSGQLIFPVQCKFYPSCSVYMEEALIEHGAVRGFFIGLKRFFKCNPWQKGKECI